MRRVMIFLLLTGFAVRVSAGFSVTEIDFLEKSGLQFNGAGPLLMQVDEARNRLVTANTLSSSVSVIDCETGDVVNIPIAGSNGCHVPHCCIVSGVRIYRCHPESYEHRFCNFLASPDRRTSAGGSQLCVNAVRGTLDRTTPICA